MSELITRTPEQERRHRNYLTHKQKNPQRAKDTARKACKKYYYANSEYFKVRNKAKYYKRLVEDHPRMLMQIRESKRRHGNRVRLENMRRKARKKGAILGDQTFILRWMDEIRSKPFARCHWCGTKVNGPDIHFDHVVAISRGGHHSIGNLCAACSDCNLSKNNRLIADWIVGGQSFLSL